MMRTSFAPDRCSVLLIGVMVQDRSEPADLEAARRAADTTRIGAGSPVEERRTKPEVIGRLEVSGTANPMATGVRPVCSPRSRAVARTVRHD
jgi:hypothetical protein